MGNRQGKEEENAQRRRQPARKEQKPARARSYQLRKESSEENSCLVPLIPQRQMKTET